jgi:hypothetical protein
VLGGTSWNTSDETILATNLSSKKRSTKKNQGECPSKNFSEERMVMMTKNHAKEGKTSKLNATVFTFSNEDIFMHKQLKARAQQNKPNRQRILADSQNQDGVIEYQVYMHVIGVEETPTENREKCKETKVHAVHNLIECDGNVTIANAKKVSSQDVHLKRQSDIKLPVPTTAIDFMKFVACCSQSGMEDFPKTSIKVSQYSQKERLNSKYAVVRTSWTKTQEVLRCGHITEEESSLPSTKLNKLKVVGMNDDPFRLCKSDVKLKC